MKKKDREKLAAEYGFKSDAEMIKDRCPSELGLIDYGEICFEKCAGEYNKEVCTQCWKDATSPELISSNVAEDSDDTVYMLTEKGKEQVRHPQHYQQAGRRECIEEMRLMFGDEKVYWWCVMTAYKYRYRMGNKDGNPAEQDEAKSEWYLDYAEEMGIK